MTIESPHPGLQHDLEMAWRAKEHLEMVKALPWHKRLRYWLTGGPLDAAREGAE